MTYWAFFFGLLDVSLSSSRVLPDDRRAAVSFDGVFTFHAEPSTRHIFRPSDRLSDIGANFSPTLLDAPIKHAVLLWMFAYIPIPSILSPDASRISVR